MTDSYNIPLAPIVDTYVPEPTVQLRTGAEELAEILSTVNPNLIKFAQQRQEKADEIQEQRAMEIIIQSDKKGLKKYIDALNKTEGPEAARQVIGRNRAFKAGIEKQVAIKLGSMAETDAKKFFNDYTVERELPDGTIQQLPLSQFSPESEEYQTALAEFNETSRMNVKGIRALYLNDYYLPQLGKGLQKVEIDHTKNYNEYLVQEAENNIGNVLKLNFYKRDDNQESLDKGLIDLTGIENPTSITGTTMSKNTSQAYLNELESNGLTQAITPTRMVDVAINVARSIFNEYENEGLNGYEAVEEFLDYIGELEVGRSQRKKDGTVVRTKFKNIISKSEDILKLKRDLLSIADDLRKERLRQEAEAEKSTILERIQQFGITNKAEMSKLAQEFPDRFEGFLEPMIEMQDETRDEFLRNFKNDLLFTGEYRNDPVRANNDLGEFVAKLGSAITEEDEREINKLEELIRTQLGVPIYQNASERIDRIIKRAEEIAGDIDPFTKKLRFTSDDAQFFYESEERFLRNVTTALKNDTLSEEQRQKAIKLAEDNFIKDAIRIKEKVYVLGGGEFGSTAEGTIAEIRKKIREEKEGKNKGGGGENNNYDDLANQGKKKIDPINIFDNTSQANKVPSGFTANEENEEERIENINEEELENTNKEELENTNKEDKLKPSSDEFIKTFEEYRDNPMKIYQLLFQ
tara:strand:- start:4586 stop:6664 length:2079 start_codon:yes stop_codon:yes gene_type:complete